MVLAHLESPRSRTRLSRVPTNSYLVISSPHDLALGYLETPRSRILSCSRIPTISYTVISNPPWCRAWLSRIPHDILLGYLESPMISYSFISDKVWLQIYPIIIYHSPWVALSDCKFNVAKLSSPVGGRQMVSYAAVISGRHATLFLQCCVTTTCNGFVGDYPPPANWSS